MKRLSVESWALLVASLALWITGGFAVVATLQGDITASGTLAGSTVGGTVTTVWGVVLVRSDLRRSP